MIVPGHYRGSLNNKRGSWHPCHGFGFQFRGFLFYFGTNFWLIPMWFAFFDCPISFTWLLLTSLPCVFKFLSFPPSMSVHLFPHVSPACAALFPLLFPVQFCTWCHYLAPGNLCPCFFFFCLCFPSFTPYSQLFDFVFLFSLLYLPPVCLD